MPAKITALMKIVVERRMSKCPRPTLAELIRQGLEAGEGLLPVRGFINLPVIKLMSVPLLPVSHSAQRSLIVSSCRRQDAEGGGGGDDKNMDNLSGDTFTDKVSKGCSFHMQILLSIETSRHKNILTLKKS